MKKGFILYLLLFCCSLGWAKDIALSGVYQDYPEIVYPDFRTNDAFLIVDGLTDTGFSVPAHCDCVKKTRLVFREPITVDELLFQNGIGAVVPGAKVVLVAASLSNALTNVLLLKNNILMRTKSGQEVVSFHESVRANVWEFTVMTTYASSNDNLAGISEVKFLENTIEYKVTNLNDANNEYFQGIRDNTLRNFKSLLSYARRVELGLKPEQFLAHMSTLGVNAEEVYRERTENNHTVFYLQASFNSNNPYEGGLMTPLKGSFYVPEKDEATGDPVINLVKPFQLAYWKIDQAGNFWVKVGSGVWKQTMPGSYFRWTDLETVVKIG